MSRASAVLVLLGLALGGCATAYGRGDSALRAGRPEEALRHLEEAHAAARGIHPRIAAQLDRVLAVLGPGLDVRVRDLIAADLDDAYEWTREVEAARRTARAPLEPAWSLVWDHGPNGLDLLHRPPLSATP